MWRTGRYTRPRGETGYTFLQRVPLQAQPEPAPPVDPCLGAITGPVPTDYEGEGTPTTIDSYAVTDTMAALITGTSPSPFVVLWVGFITPGDDVYACYPVVNGIYTIDDYAYPDGISGHWDHTRLNVWGAPINDPDANNWDGGGYSSIDLSEIGVPDTTYCWPNT